MKVDLRSLGRRSRGFQIALICICVLSGALSGRGQLSPGEAQDGNAWQDWLEEPMAVPVKLFGDFDAKGVFGVYLNGFGVFGTNSTGLGCGGEWGSTSESRVYMIPYHSYTLWFSGTNVHGADATLTPESVHDLLSGKGKNANQYRRYRIYVKNKDTEIWERLINPQTQLAWDCENDNGGSCCVQVDFLPAAKFEVQVRPDLTARPVTKGGPRRVRADDQGDDSWSRDESGIYGAMAPGDGGMIELGPGRSDVPAVISLRWEVLLGRLWNGNTAGRLRYQQTALTTNSFNAASLLYSPRSYNSNELELLTWTNAAAQVQVRQIVAPQTFLDVVTVTSNRFDLNFYLLSAKGTRGGDGYFGVNSGAYPFVSWRFESADGTTNQLRISEIRTNRTDINLVTYNPTTGIWSSAYGSGNEARIETRTVVTNAVGGTMYRTETQEIKSGSNAISDKTVEVYTKFPWAYELTSVTNDPGGANLITALAYFSDTNSSMAYRYKQLNWITYPDGFWERRQYSVDGDAPPYNPPGALDRVVRPWKDSPIGAADLDCLVTELKYTDIATGSFYLQSSQNRLADDTTFKRLTYMELTDHADDWDTESEFRQFGSTLHYGEMTEIKSYAEDGGSLLGSAYSHVGKIGWCDSYDYEFGTYNPITYAFTPSTSGTDLRKTVYHGTLVSDTQSDVLFSLGESGYDIEDVWLTPNKSVKEVFILRSGALALKEQYVFTGASAFARLERIAYTRDSLGHATNIARIDAALTSQVRTIYTADWRGAAAVDGNLKLWEMDEGGVQTLYTYDSLKRLKTQRKVGASVSGYPSQGDIVQTFYYDSAGRVLTNVVSSGALAQTNAYAFDKAGRKTSQRTPDNLTTTYAYANGGRVTTTTASSGATEIVANYLDRRPASITGTAEVNQFLDYDLTIQGSIDALYPKNITTTTLAAANALRWTKATTDHRGKLAEERKPGFNSTNDVVKTYLFDITAQNTLTTQTGLEDANGTVTDDVRTFREFNLYGEAAREGLDADLNQSLEIGTTDRVTDTATYYEKDSFGYWFKVTQSIGYLTDGNSSPSVLSTIKQRQTGLASSEVSESWTFDANNNRTTSKTTVNRVNKTLTTVTSVPESTLSATSIAVNGLLQTESTPSVNVPSWHYYDALAREVAVTDPLGFTSGAAYDPSTGQATARTNRFQQVTAYTYFLAGGANAGLLKSETGPTGKVTYYDYNARGQLYRKWGDVPYPEERTYDNYGALSQLKTYRAGGGWNGSTWPASPGTPDVTQWLYDGATGLLTNKTDAASKTTTYSYYNNQQLKTRTWGRISPVTTTSVYAEIGDLEQINYSDGTPNVVFGNYDRRGLPRSITDARGARTLVYDVLGRQTSDSGASGSFSGINVITHYHAFYGRDYLQLQVPGQTTIEQDFGYESTGRLNTVYSGAYSAVYGYLPSSDLVQTTTDNNSGSPVLTATRAWEFGGRLRSIANVVGSAAVSAHTYSYDALQRRRQATLADSSLWNYDYNDRDELIAGKRYWADWTPVAGQQFEFGYDTIGNRTTTKEGGDATGLNLRSATYSVNNLDQYGVVPVPGAIDVIGAAYATASVTVNGQATTRKGEYYRAELNVSNGTTPVYQAVTAAATQTPNSSNVVVSLLVGPGNQSLSYDGGNQTQDGLWAYTWDGENRLSSVQSLSSVPNAAKRRLEFTYDYLGRRITKVVKTWTGSTYGNAVTTKCVYDGWNLVAELDGSNNRLRSYLWGQDLSGTLDGAGGVGGLLMVTTYGTGAGNYFAAYDGNGNVTALVKTDGSIGAQYEYAPFGKLIRATGPMARTNPFRFSTKFTDDETQFSYFGKRYYDPAIGRWLSRDPMEEEGGTTSMPLSANNPLNDFDALGNEIEEEEVAAGAEASMEGGGASQAIGLLMRVKNTVDAFNSVQEFTSAVMDSATGDSDELYATLLSAGANVLVNGLINKATSGLGKKFEMHHIFPKRADLAKEFKDAGVNIEDFLVRLERNVHKGVHQGGPRGGDWNSDWTAFLTRGKKKSASEIFDFAIELMQKYGVNTSQL